MTVVIMFNLDINNSILDKCDIVLSHFNVRKGPVILFSTITILNDNFFIPGIMDIHSTKDFFIYYYNKFISFNYCFIIKDSNIRGGEHDLMLSLVCNIDDRDGDFFDYISEIEEQIKKLSLMVKDISGFEELFEIKNHKGDGS